MINSLNTKTAFLSLQSIFAKTSLCANKTKQKNQTRRVIFFPTLNCFWRSTAHIYIFFNNWCLWMMNDAQPTLTYYLFASAHPVDWIFTPPHSRARHNVFLMHFSALTFLGFEQGSLTLMAVTLQHHNQVFMRQQRGGMKGIWFDRPSASKTKRSTVEGNRALASEGRTGTLRRNMSNIFSI